MFLLYQECLDCPEFQACLCLQLDLLALAVHYYQDYLDYLELLDHLVALVNQDFQVYQKALQVQDLL